MKSHPKLLLSRNYRLELVHTCNELLIKAARDLAEFTKHGLNANFIVSLAHKCEDFENMMKQPRRRFNKKKFAKIEKEIIDSLTRICETGKHIWNNHPKYGDYVISLTTPLIPQAVPGPANVA